MKQLTIKQFKTAVLACFLAGLFSCNEDKGNYVYTEINSVKIGDAGKNNGLNDRTYAIGDTMRVNPVLTFSMGEDESNFAFTWYYKIGKLPYDTLQVGRNLKIAVSGPIGRPTTDSLYVITYEVVNKKTQIPYRASFTLKVTNPLARGYAALCEHDNGFDIDMIVLASDNKFNFYKNVLEMSNSELPRAGVKPYDIVAYTDQMAPNPYKKEGIPYSVYILTNQYTTRIQALDYSWKPSYDISNSIEPNSYIDKEYVQKGKPVIASQMKAVARIVNSTYYPRVLFYHKEPSGQGNWYVYSGYPAIYLFSVRMNDIRPSGGARYEPAPFIYAGTNGVMYYDADHKKFMYSLFPTTQYTSSALWYTEALPEESAGAAFNFSDPNDGLLYMGEILGANTPSAGYAILKQTDGSFKYIEFVDATSLANVITTANKRRASILSASSNIGNAKFFARTPSASSPFLYYVTNDNRVYKADVSSVTAVVQEITSSILANDGYNEITLFKYMYPNTNGIPGNIAQALAVGSYNASLGKATGGKLEFFIQSNAASGDLARTKYPNGDPLSDGYQIDMSWKGLGRIVGLSYKQQ